MRLFSRLVTSFCIRKFSELTMVDAAIIGGRAAYDVRAAPSPWLEMCTVIYYCTFGVVPCGRFWAARSRVVAVHRGHSIIRRDEL